MSKMNLTDLEVWINGLSQGYSPRDIDIMLKYLAVPYGIDCMSLAFVGEVLRRVRERAYASLEKS